MPNEVHPSRDIEKMRRAFDDAGLTYQAASRVAYCRTIGALRL